MPGVAPLAILPPPPPQLPPWAKVIWYLAETAAVGTAYLGFDYGQEMLPAGGAAGTPDAHEWRRWRFLFEDTISGEAADDQVFSIDIVNYTNGQIDSSWTDTDHLQVETALRTFAGNVMSAVVNRMSFTRLDAYRMTFRPYSESKPFSESGPPVWSQAVSVPGVGATAQIPQASCTITERTPSRKHWGRLYLPTFGTANLTTGGRITSAAVDAIAGYYSAMVEELEPGFLPVVPTTQVQKVPTRTLQSVTAVSVDNVPDAHHRRRFKSQTYRKILPLPT